MRSFKLLLYFTGFLLFFFVFSCKKDTTKTIDFKYGYFPTDTGHYVIYEVDSITYNDFTSPKITIDTFHFYIKELIQSVFLDNTNSPTYKVLGFKGTTLNGPWPAQPTYVWTSNRYTTTAQKTESNLRFIKLIFPPSLTTLWLGNSYIDCVDTNSYLAGWVYAYQNIDVPCQITSSSGTLSFDSTLTVLQAADSNALAKTYSVEKYAKNVGLIYKELDVLMLDSTNTNSRPWPSRANNGFTFTMKAVAYNK